MELFLLSLFAIGSVQSLSIGYPYRSVWTYNPAVAQLPVHGYLRYLDGGAATPVYAVRQIKYFTSDSPVHQTSPTNKFDEINFRSWSLLQYQNLKRDIEAVRAGGKEPSAEILEKFQALEKIVITPNFSTIADLPEVKCIIQDYTQSISFNEALQSSHIQQTQGEVKTYTGISSTPLVAIEEAPETKQAREEHLRIYNEQIAQLKQLELEHQKYINEAANVKQEDYAKTLAALERAQKEHFRLWNEAKLRAEQAGYDSAAKNVYESAEKQQISTVASNQNTLNLKQSQDTQNVAQTESLKTTAHQESSRSYNTLVDQTVSQPQQVVVRDEHSRLVDSSGSQSLKSNSPADSVEEIAKVVHAHEEHLRIVDEAVAKAQTAHKEEEKQRQERVEQSQQNVYEGPSITPVKDQQDSLISKHNTEQQNLKSVLPVTSHGQQTDLIETPEVAKAREEHLRLVQEANVRAQFVEQQESKYKHQSQTPILTTQYPHEQLVYQPVIQETPEVIKAREQHLRLVNEIKSKTNNQVQLQEKQRSAQSFGIEETPEVQRAREEHLRIFDAIKSQVENEQAIKNERKTTDSSTSLQLDKDMTEEERFLELERIREVERLQKEQQLLEIERLREAKRLAEEEREMEAELIRLRMEDEQRLEMERLLEAKRLQEEQEELQRLQSEGYQEIVLQDNSGYQQPQQIEFISSEQSIAKSNIPQQVNVPLSQQYAHNPYLKTSHVINEPLVNRLQHSISNQQQDHSIFSHNPFLKSGTVHVPATKHHQLPVSTNVQEQSSDNALSSFRYVQSSQQSSGNKHQYVKDDHYVKDKYHNTASSQPADTAEVLIALERATKDHFRAHEIALEQLRLARLQNPQLKDCN